MIIISDTGVKFSEFLGYNVATIANNFSVNNISKI